MITHGKTELIVIQPSSFCNINCRYCYVPDRKDKQKISDDLLEETLQKILSSDLVANNFMLLWHASEPLSVGIDFYEKVVSLINKYNILNKKIINAIQTNATLIDDSWCDFFKKNNFQIGISLDGPEFLHNKNRVGWDGKGTFHKVMKGVDFLKKHHIKLSAICVITKDTLNYPTELFNFFVDNGFDKLSFVIEEIIGENTSSSLNDSRGTSVPTEIKQKYANFMSILFKLWVPIKDRFEIREFIEMCSMISKAKTYPEFAPSPQEVTDLHTITIQKNGNITTYCPELAGGTSQNRDQFVISNIRELNKLDDILLDKRFIEIRNDVNIGISNCKQSCNYFKLCGGRSPGVKMYETNSFHSTETKHCILHRQTLTNVVINELKQVVDLK